jgi:hypothetical protein
MLLTPSLKEAILYRLGYNASNSLDYSTNLDLDFFSVTVSRFSNILTELENIDEKILLSLNDSMAMKVDDITVDYKQHYRHLLHEGHRLLGELSSLIAIPIKYDRYLECNHSHPDVAGGSNSNSFYSYY